MPLTTKSVDVVSIATPNHWHAPAAIWAIGNFPVPASIDYNLWAGPAPNRWHKAKSTTRKFSEPHVHY